MSREDDIRAAEIELLEATLADESEDFERPNSRYRVRTACDTLRALRSPLPTREEMCGRHECLVTTVNGTHRSHLSFGAIAEQHWSDCLRWVAQEKVYNNANQARFLDWANELEERP